MVDHVVALGGQPVLVDHRLDARSDHVQPQRAAQLLPGQLAHQRQAVGPLRADPHDALRVGPAAVHEHQIQRHAAAAEDPFGHGDFAAAGIVVHARREIGHPLDRPLHGPGAVFPHVPLEVVRQPFSRPVRAHADGGRRRGESSLAARVLPQRDPTVLVRRVERGGVLHAQEHLPPREQRPADRDVPRCHLEGHRLLVETLQLQPGQAERFHVDPVQQVLAGVDFQSLAEVELAGPQRVHDRDANGVLRAPQRHLQLDPAVGQRGLHRSLHLEIGRRQPERLVVQGQHELARTRPDARAADQPAGCTATRSAGSARLQSAARYSRYPATSGCLGRQPAAQRRPARRRADKRRQPTDFRRS